MYEFKLKRAFFSNCLKRLVLADAELGISASSIILFGVAYGLTRARYCISENAPP